MSKTEQKKDYTLSLEDRGNYLFAEVKGEQETLEIATAYWTEIARYVMRSGKKKLLVVQDIPDVVSIAEVHELVTGLSNLPVKDVNVAFVDLHPGHASLNEFGILVSENRGFSVQAFESEGDAESWLLNS